MEKFFLGTNYGHGSSAALITEDGKLVYALEEGRLIGKKHTSTFPIESLKILCKLTDGGSIFWAEGWHIYQRLLYKGLLSSIKYGLREPFYFKHRLLKELLRFHKGHSFYRNSICNLQNKGIRLVGHHLAHAYSLLPWCLPAKSLILVSDTTGEKESISSFYWSGEKMISLACSAYPYSIGSIYHQMAYHLGFKGLTGPGKLMALSSRGDPIWLKELQSIGSIVNGKFCIDFKVYPAWKIHGGWFDFASQQSDSSLKKEILSSHDNHENGVNLAASIQRWFTETTLECIIQSLGIAREQYHYEVQHIGLAGGAALNCQANGEIIQRISKFDIDSVTVSPWSDDQGTAIGAAAWMLHKEHPDVRIKTTEAFLGPNAYEQITTSVSDDDISNAVQAIIAGYAVALVSGRLEFGPRALGGRCILADPRKKEIADKLNKMKGRPTFMPFAPVVLEEDFNRYFEGNGSTNMAWTVHAKPDALKSIPAVIHVNGESRVQVLRTEKVSLLLKILKDFKNKTDCGVLLLTSLNGSGEAIPAYMNSAEAIARRIEVAGLIWDGGWKKFG